MATTTTPKASGFKGAIDRYFEITARGSTFPRELRGGLVTFLAMCYILALNPIILGGPDGTGAVLGGERVAAATALVAGVLTILMGIVARFPLAIAAGLGLNALVAFGIASIPEMTWADAMGLVVLEGIIILILVFTGFREAVFKAVPTELKTAISVGIGLFIALIGLVDAGFVSPGNPVLQLGFNGSLAGWPILVFVLGLLAMAVLWFKKVKGAILYSIIGATVLAVIIELVAKIGPKIGADGTVNPVGWSSTVPAPPEKVAALPDFGLLGQFSLFGSVEKIGIVAVILLVFSLMLADFFDTMGTMVAVGGEAGLLDEKGNPPRTRQILVVDSVAAAAGGAASVSSNTSYIESAAGVGEGARTGLASVVTGIAFLLATFLSPLVAMVPIEAVAPALVLVGFLMAMGVTGIDWKKFDIAFPAFLVMILMPFTYSITVGIGAGFISYVVLKLAKRKASEIHPLMWVSSVLFVIYFVQGPIRAAVGF
ncbi:MAG: NCS2 family permease [Actinomycetales bacterium]|nr:NCS2 family permease [Actinomycetales bacterium]